VHGKQADALARTMVDSFLPYRKNVRTITSDNGTEFARHKEVSERIGADFFFAHSYSSWERGINGHSNKLVRQYIPKKQPLEDLNEQEINQIQIKINRRPRKKLGYDTPARVFFQQLAVIYCIRWLNLRSPFGG